MSKERFDHTSLLKTAIATAIKAGKEILNVYLNLDFKVELKADESPLTIADKRAHNIIVENLMSTKIPILSEEGITIDYAERKNWKIFWLVDPLDGTKEFIKRNDEFTVNIALIENNIPIAGVIYLPVTKQLYWGDKNGSFKADVDDLDETYNNIQKLPLSVSKEDFVVVGSKSHSNPATESYIKTIDTKGKNLEVEQIGSSLKICRIAEGTADVYPKLGPTMEWDTAAGHAIALFAGKNILQFENHQPLQYNKENLLNPWFIVK